MCIISALVAGGMSVAAAWATTISTATAIIGTAVSTTMGVVSAQQSANAQKAQNDYNAKIAKKNAQIAQANADQKRQEGIEEARQQRMKTLRTVGSQQAAMAANGIDISSGTALDVIEDTAAMGELDALTTRYNYESQAIGLEQQANNFNNQATLDSFAGQNAYKAGMINAVGTGFKGLADTASVASKWYGGNSNTIKSGTKVSGGVKGDPITFA